MRKENPDTLILFSITNKNLRSNLKKNIETILGISTTIVELNNPSFLTYLKKIYSIVTQHPDNKFVFIGTRAPARAILAIFILGSFFDIRIDFKENGQEFIIPNQTALSFLKKKLKVLKLIEKEKPGSLEDLINILSARKQLNGTRKNMRAKISYSLGIIQKNGLISIGRGDRGKLEMKLTPIGKELVKLLD